MRTLILLLLCAAIARGNARAEDSKLANLPVEITASGDTNYENGIATAHDNVAIHVGDTDIYGDSARYDTKTHDIYVEGNVRIYRQISLFVGEKAVYNLDTKQIRAVNMRTEREPYFVTGTEVTSDAEGEYI
ncbi:MAG: LPS export ABC transporter periplasmic protein LptC, partial [Chthoniobacterales bacterium]|nr:LPS export ABC transporter periplasmic protein LptC [Chthoniobacterales bacterium]